MKTYDVAFINCRDGGLDKKILMANSIADIVEYMENLGHTVMEVKIRLS